VRQVREAVQSLVSDLREAETRPGQRRVEEGEEDEAGWVSKVGKQCEERADVDVGSSTGKAKASLRGREEV
jgi:hypothetical protein